MMPASSWIKVWIQDAATLKLSFRRKERNADSGNSEKDQSTR